MNIPSPAFQSLEAEVKHWKARSQSSPAPSNRSAARAPSGAPSPRGVAVIIGGWHEARHSEFADEIEKIDP